MPAAIGKMTSQRCQLLVNALAISALVFLINFVYMAQYSETYSKSYAKVSPKFLQQFPQLSEVIGLGNFSRANRTKNKSLSMVRRIESVVEAQVQNSGSTLGATPSAVQSTAGSSVSAVKPFVGDMYSEKHELKLNRMMQQVASDPMDELLEKQILVQERYLASKLGLTERPEKAMLELCTKYVTCYGLGDRFFGLMANFLTAVIAGRAFFVVHNKPADLNVHLEPNKINWHVDAVQHEGVREALTDIDNHHCDISPHCTHQVLELPNVPGGRIVNGATLDKPIIHSWGNARTDVLFEAMTVGKLFPVLKPGQVEWSQEDKQFWAAHTSSRLWSHLFRFSDSLKKSADELLAATFKTPAPYNFETTMLCTPCIHARTGSGLREPTRHRNVDDFVKCMDKVTSDVKRSEDARCVAHRAAGSNWIVLSDSSFFIDDMTEKFKSKGTIFSTSGSGPIVHAETIQFGSDRAVKGLRRAMIDFYILSHCR